MVLIMLIIIITLIIFALKFRYLLSFLQKSRLKRFQEKCLPKNMTLSHCPSDPQSNDRTQPKSRSLTVIFAWINAKDKILEKFKQLWFEKGFDVLIVRTSIFDAILPPIGSQIVAKNVVKVLSDLSLEYNEIVVHSFSVGGYQFGEVLVQLTAEEKYKNIRSLFKGFVMDSIVFAKDRGPGVSRTITTNPVLQPMLEKTINLFFILFHNITIKHYNKSEELIVSPPEPYPGLIFYSKNDLMSTLDSNENLVKTWIQMGNDIRKKCWEQSKHVLHYRYHQKEYEQELDLFVKSLKLKNYKSVQ